jgi:hypothetical protein
MTTPHLSAPILVHPTDLKSNPELTEQITCLTNEAFGRSKQAEPEKWDPGRPRFPTHESYYEMLVDGTTVALIFDQEATDEGAKAIPGGESKDVMGGKVVACAAAVPWKGGWAKEGAGKEEGWEIKAIAVNGDEKYLRKGLAVQVMKALEDDLIVKARKRSPQSSSLTWWILAADCINGAYWRKRGYREVRRKTEGAGTWACKTSFDMVVLRKDVEFDTST